MHIVALVDEISKLIEQLRTRHGDFKLAMLYNRSLEMPTSWNLIIAADWTDNVGIGPATHLIAKELHERLVEEVRSAISRISVLSTNDRFVREMTSLHPVLNSKRAVPVSPVIADGITEGVGFLFYSQPGVPA
jgi:hypothetical protein